MDQDQGWISINEENSNEEAVYLDLSQHILDLGDPLYGIPGISEETTTNNETIINEFHEASQHTILENQRVGPQRPVRRTRRAKYYTCGKYRYTMEAKYFSKTQ